MSVLNQMLRDLEKRGALPAVVAAAGTATVARPALATPPVTANLRRRWIWIAVLGAAAALVGVHTWLSYRVQDASVVRAPLGSRQFGSVASPAAPAVAAQEITAPAAVVAVAPVGEKPVLTLDPPLHAPTPPRRTVAVPAVAAPAAPKTARAAAPAPKPVATPAQTPAALENAPAAVVVRSGSDVASDVDRAAELIARGRAHEAMELLIQVLGRQPTHAAARSSLAALLAEAGRREHALHVLLAGSEFDAASFGPPAAQLQAEMGDLTGALQTLAKVPAARRSGAYEALHAGLAQRAGDHMTAIASYRRALSQASPDAVWWVGLAVSLEATGEPVEARAAYARAAGEARLPADVRRYVTERVAALDAHSQRNEGTRRASLANVF